jgi:hypothetical protein
MYMLPSDGYYLCNEERNFGLPSHRPWAIPEFVDFDAGARSLSCLLSRCDVPTRPHPTRQHDYELLSRDEVVQRFREAILLEVH